MWRRATVLRNARRRPGVFSLLSQQRRTIMQRTLLTLALMAAAGTAVAQTATPPAAGGGSTTTPSTTAPPVSTPTAPSQTMGAGSATPGMNQPSETYDTNTANAPRLTG